MREYVIPIIEAGARGFITKMAAFSELASAIQAVYREASFLSPMAAAAQLFDDLLAARGIENVGETHRRY